MKTPTGHTPVFQLNRGGIVESLHYGAAAVVDSHGHLLSSVGDPVLRTFLRSSAKPFQALPFFEHGGPAHFGLSGRETALICASHSGTDEHAAAAAGIQAKAGIQESDLQCGTHAPIDPDTRRRLEAAGEEPTANRHNCSGKHSGMLACSKLMGWPLDTYLEPDHPLQRLILATLGEMSDLSPDEITVGTDGCSAPNFAMPLLNAALGYARLADPKNLVPQRGAACRAITSAMTQHPDMIAGPGTFTTCLMEVGRGAIVAKSGAEGYYGIGLMPGAAWDGSPGIGIAMKISDGSRRRLARSAFALEILRLLGALEDYQLAELAAFGPRKGIYNYREIEVGTAEPCFELQQPA